jgi:hypothetical protein
MGFAAVPALLRYCFSREELYDTFLWVFGWWFGLPRVLVGVVGFIVSCRPAEVLNSTCAKACADDAGIL